jgi:hypothetical protein
VTESAKRAWCGRIQYPDKKPILIGSIVMSSEAQFHEVEAALIEMASKHLPSGFKVCDMLPGLIYFVPEADS